MSQYPYNGPYTTTSNQPTYINPNTGLGTTGTNLGPGQSTGLSTGLGTGIGYGTGLSGPSNVYDTHSGLNTEKGLGTVTSQGISSNEPIVKKKHRPQSRSSSSSSSSKQQQEGQKQSFGQKIKNFPAKVKQMVTKKGHHQQNQQHP